MADGAQQQTARYSAFISYNHRDVAFARALRRRLENYRLPRRLGRQNNERFGNGHGAVSRRLRPIFRDREELVASADLTDAVQEAIAQSSFMIVICTQNSARSKWVGREIELFRALHGDAAILAALYEGSSADAFHPALLGGGLGGRSLQPLAADFRRQGDGPRLALLKLVAALADVPLDALVQRDAQRRIRQAAAIGIAALAGMAVMTALTVIAMNARATAERDRARGESVIDGLLTDMRGRLKGVGRLDVLDALNQSALRYYSNQNLAHLPASELLQRAKLLQAIGEDDEKRGNLDAARAQFEETWRTTAALLAAQPDDTARIFAHAQSEFWIAEIDWRVGDMAGAEKGFKAYLALARRLVDADPENPDWLMERGYAEDNLAMFAMRHLFDLNSAEQFLRAELADFEAAVRRRPDDHDVQVSVADAYGSLGDIARLRGDYDSAQADRDKQRELLTRLAARDPRDSVTRSNLIANQLALARIDAGRGALREAIGKLEQGRRAARQLAEADPDNTSMAMQARIFDLFEARTWLAMPMENRPADAVIIAALGNCDIDRVTFHTDELAAFCTVLQARRLAQAGQSAAANALLDSTRSSMLTSRDRLSTIWGINFAEEIRAAATQ